ncbi:MAG TPA: hypothetical protein VFC79_12075 [Tissierellaceae bacterium]|nr:hypothetical protein [Tissierellaceae bacterium]
MNYTVGDIVRVFGTNRHVEIIGIEEGVQVNIYGSMIDTYKVKGTNKLYVDMFDFTISEI